MFLRRPNINDKWKRQYFQICDINFIFDQEKLDHYIMMKMPFGKIKLPILWYGGLNTSRSFFAQYYS